MKKSIAAFLRRLALRIDPAPSFEIVIAPISPEVTEWMRTKWRQIDRGAS